MSTFRGTRDDGGRPDGFRESLRPELLPLRLTACGFESEEHSGKVCEDERVLARGRFGVVTS
jgi:hypothetical protein